MFVSRAHQMFKKSNIRALNSGSARKALLLCFRKQLNLIPKCPTQSAIAKFVSRFQVQLGNEKWVASNEILDPNLAVFPWRFLRIRSNSFT
jgi:hypothetical protein